ncbi:MAG: segregation/condensation protein A [Desulfobacterales bacterium]|nr:segregation/condensation protein A [Desulfobacterales bacterium]
MIDECYKIRLENIFEGPMDLLVYLITKNEINIYDIPIALITDQYLEYLKWMKSMDVDLAGDFIVMAATLVHIKSKMLLPIHGDEEPEEDPRQEITRPLLEYLQMKSAAEFLAERNFLGADTFVRNFAEEDYPIDKGNEMIRVGLFELIQAFQKIFAQMSEQHRVDLTTDAISIKDKISELVDILEKKGSVGLDELYSKNAGNSEIIITFLAILEMAKLCIISMFQQVQTGDIRLLYL